MIPLIIFNFYFTTHKLYDDYLYFNHYLDIIKWSLIIFGISNIIILLAFIFLLHYFTNIQYNQNYKYCSLLFQLYNITVGNENIHLQEHKILILICKYLIDLNFVCNLIANFHFGVKYHIIIKFFISYYIKLLGNNLQF